MKKIKTFEQFKLNEDYTEAGENAGLYDELANLIQKAVELTGEDVDTPDDAILALHDAIDNNIEGWEEAQDLIAEIDSVLDALDEVEAQAFYNQENED